MSKKWISVLLLLQLSCYFSPTSCGKVLVWPTEYSHWLNMKAILDELVQRGHEVVVLKSSDSIFMDSNKSSAIKFEIYTTPLKKDDFSYLFETMLNKWIYDLPKETFWTYIPQMEKSLRKYYEIIIQLCRGVILNKKLMTKLQESRFDVVLADAVGPCGELLAEMFQIPFVYSLRFSMGFAFEKYIGELPLPPSYIPVTMSQLRDKMTFMERVKNMLYVLYFDLWFQVLDEKKWDQFYSEVLGKSHF